MEPIHFSKLNGQGNDFIVINSMEEQYELSKGLISKICDRHFGIGADGIILVRKSSSADFLMDYYNQDGSLAEMCGNGIRCMARFVIENKLWTREHIKIETRAGIKLVEVKFDKSTGKAGDIKVNMGKPVFEPDKIPVDIQLFSKRASGSGNEKLISDYPLIIGGRELRINCVSMGNPHCIIFLDKSEDLGKFPLHIYGPKIENDPFFPNRTNVEFVKTLDKNELSVRVWERGVGETLACGTGACAAAVCSAVLEKADMPQITVNMPGGKLNICWNGENCNVFLEGTVEHVFDGEYIL